MCVCVCEREREREREGGEGKAAGDHNLLLLLEVPQYLTLTPNGRAVRTDRGEINTGAANGSTGPVLAAIVHPVVQCRRVDLTAGRPGPR